MFKPNVYNLETSVCIAHQITGTMFCGVYPSSSVSETIGKLAWIRKEIGQSYCVMKCSTAYLIAADHYGGLC